MPFFRLPTNPDEMTRALEAARQIDPDAKLHECRLPVGPQLETHSMRAIAWAKLHLDEVPSQSFKLG